MLYLEFLGSTFPFNINRMKQDKSVGHLNMVMKLPFFSPHGVIVRNMLDNYLLVTTNFGIMFTWDWASRLEVTAAANLKEKVY